MSKEKIKDFLFTFLLFFSIFYLTMWGWNTFFAEKPDEQAAQEGVTFEVRDSTPVLGHLLEFDIRNVSEGEVFFPPPCESEDSSLSVQRIVSGKSVDVFTTDSCDPNSVMGFRLQAGESLKYSIPQYSADIFTEAGDYTLTLSGVQVGQETKTLTSETIAYREPGFFRKIFRALILQPFFNLLIFFTEILPWHSLGGAIILLTILIRVVLFYPNQKAMRSQRELQLLQPKMEELRAKYEKNPQMLAMKTMELYKEHQVNPMSSCLPIVAQFPILLGLYFVVRDGLSPHLSYLLYSFYPNPDFGAIHTGFLWMDLSQVDFIVLPILVGLAQFAALKLALVRVKKKKKEGNHPAPKNDFASQMEQMQGTMAYIMPVMIAVFTVTFPAAVGLYWFTSTVFGIGQQQLVNWHLDRNPPVRKKKD